MAMNGIDISSWQTNIDISAVPCDFVIVKATEGVSYVNPDCARAVEQALSCGKLAGVYHYAEGQGADAEASFFVSQVSGWIGKVILVLDWESGGNSQFGNGDYAKQFCDKVFELTGVQPIVYVSSGFMGQLSNIGDRGLWVAQYADNSSTGYQDNPWNYGNYGEVIFQYSSHGSLPWYSGYLDLNRTELDSETWMKYAAGTGKVNVPNPPVNPAPITPPDNGQVYTIQSGDTLSSIASQFGTTVQSIASLNSIVNVDLIYPGQQIRIQGSSPAAQSNQTYTVKSGDTLSDIASKFGTTWQDIANKNNVTDANLIYPGQVLTIGSGSISPVGSSYVVKSGDNLSDIASSHGTSWQTLAATNGISNPNMIYPGQVLQIP